MPQVSGALPAGLLRRASNRLNNAETRWENETQIWLPSKANEDGIYSHHRYRIIGTAGTSKSRLCRVSLTQEDKIARLELLPE